MSYGLDNMTYNNLDGNVNFESNEIDYTYSISGNFDLATFEIETSSDDGERLWKIFFPKGTDKSYPKIEFPESLSIVANITEYENSKIILTL